MTTKPDCAKQLPDVYGATVHWPGDMTNTQKSHNTLPIWNIFAMSGKVFLRNCILFSILIFVVHYISYSFIWELFQSIGRYAHSVYSWDIGKSVHNIFLIIAKSTSILDENYQIQHRAQKLTADAQSLSLFVSYVTLLLAVFVQLICNLLNQKDRLKLTPANVVECFERQNFVIYICRTVGILAIFQAGFLLVGFISVIVTDTMAEMIFYALGMTLGDFRSILNFTVMGIVCICAFSRFLTAIPVSVVENKGVMESLTISWKITGSSWPQIVAVWILASVFIFLIRYFLYLAFELTQFAYGKISSIDEKMEIEFAIFGGDVWTHVVVGGAVVAIVMSVCYHFLRKNVAK